MRRRTALKAGLLASAASLARAEPAGGSGLGPRTWRFEPAADHFSPEALLDLRTLNEKVAGQSGFVRVGPDGTFLRGDGQPLRLWAVNTEVGRGAFDKNGPDLARHARFLAKRGVNMVRLHRQLSPDLSANPNAAMTDINVAERDGIWRTVAAMKKEGIYTTVSPYWAGPLRLSPHWSIPGGAQQSAFGLLFFDPTLQAGYKSWLKQLLTDINPYTGIALGQDPSLALIQLQNEDSLLFWTLGTLAPVQRQALEQRFGHFLAGKYGSVGNAQSAWQHDRAPRDDPDAGRMTLVDLSALTGPGEGGRGRRLADQTEFYARTMFDFNARMVRYLHDELGARQLVNAGNWKTASPVRLGDVERWSYTPGQVDATNVYSGGIHQGPNNGWAIQNGDKFTNESLLFAPRSLPLNLKQTQGRPMLVTEGGWIMPNGYAAEGPFLIAAYSSLCGIAGYYWFTTHEEGWSPPQSGNGYLPSQAKWLFANPDMLGSFPAAALAYRMGYIARGKAVLIENRSLQDLWDRKTPLIAEQASFDPNRDAGDIAPRSSIKTGSSPDAFLVGPVLLAFDADPAKSTSIPLGPFVQGDSVRSQTGQILMNSRAGTCTIDAPKAQGVVAHFKGAPRHQLSDVRFTSGNAFGAALAVALDDLPLRESRRVLLQFATRSRPTGWSEAPTRIDLQGQGSVSGLQVESFGHAPWQVEAADLEVVLRNPNLHRATVLDMNGLAVGEVPLIHGASKLTLRFPENAMYLLLR